MEFSEIRGGGEVWGGWVSAGVAAGLGAVTVAMEKVATEASGI